GSADIHNQFTVFGLTPRGALDPSFNPDGATPGENVFGFNGGSRTQVGGLGLTPAGDIIVAGTVFGTAPGTNGGGGAVAARLVGSADGGTGKSPSGFVPAVPGTVMVGGAGGGTVQVLNPTNGTYAPAGTMTIYNGFVGNVRTAVADVNGDGT